MYQYMNHSWIGNLTLVAHLPPCLVLFKVKISLIRIPANPVCPRSSCKVEECVDFIIAALTASMYSYSFLCNQQLL